MPLFGLLLAVEADGVRQVGVLSAPALRERWYAKRGGGAWSVGAAGTEGPRQIRVSGITSLDDSQMLHGSFRSIEDSARAPGFRELLGSVWRERGFGDFWGYALVAEGAAEGMIEIGVNPWDLAAPEVLVEEAGGLLTDLDGPAGSIISRCWRRTGCCTASCSPDSGAPAVAMAAWPTNRGPDQTMTGSSGRRFASLEVRLGLIAAAVAVLWAILVLDPLAAGTTIDPDASSSVLYFDRIAAFRHLEAFVPTTPKPLLTLIYGVTWEIGRDWRWLTFETIAVFGAAVGLAAALVARLAARIVAITTTSGSANGSAVTASGSGPDDDGGRPRRRRGGDGRPARLIGPAARSLARELAGLGPRSVAGGRPGDDGYGRPVRGWPAWRCSLPRSADSRRSPSMRWRSRSWPWRSGGRVGGSGRFSPRGSSNRPSTLPGAEWRSSATVRSAC